MVIGNGLLGKSMSLFVDHDDVLIFASGVSNSKENRPSEYEREFNLLHKFLGTEQKIIYFSTCSVLYDCIKQTDYIINHINKNCSEKIHDTLEKSDTIFITRSIAKRVPRNLTNQTEIEEYFEQKNITIFNPEN